MAMTRTCLDCGQPVPLGQQFCECGALVEVTGPTFLPPEGIELPRPNVGLPAPPSRDFSLSPERMGKLPTLDGIALRGLKLDLSAGRAAEGRKYRPVFVIGQMVETEGVLGMPFGVARLQSGDIYVIDFVDESGRARVQRFDASGQVVETVREFEVGDNPEALDTPTCITVDAARRFYIADMGTSAIKRFAPDATVEAVFGSAGTADNQLQKPRAVEVDDRGNLYVADTGNSRVLKWDPQGRCLLALGINKPDEDAEWLLAGDQPGEFDEPMGVAVDGGGNIFVADTNNHRVQAFSPAGELLLIFGAAGDGAGQLSYPAAIRLDSNGDLYVSDSDGTRIQKFDAQGHFVYQLILPGDAGRLSDFVVDDAGRLLVALRDTHLVVNLEVV